ncbi:hypothetical protein [Fluoribacter gormanii]|uniref:1D-myo-inositol 2-acetamido-2-deoxy-alpha-D-glucopyranoside deacetylase n=1 Tax=Fluoribacter gormanii TaxID=464 RepID=A0A377GG45_9GAMM|nr:hypothetical protein [Fluoribacter gormanii]KTD02724.1 1D-myo-inositol 2-acetamido-2-deoxy-alpha-D-glucopyranoside deacetylase [Fluoribacter gormanii]SIR60019.1 hypothetical protein SAMN05421777_11693 [Fluoribacter gormanii]STO23741.1 Uncharacterised protein [Fluoribacter gormanii]
MKALIVAHPDDEIIWFPAKYFDLIVIAFLARHDRPHAAQFRRFALNEHPLNDRLLLLEIDESGYWKDKKRQEQFIDAKTSLYHSLLELKSKYSFTEIFTHNSVGEYGHDDHILVHDLVKEIFSKTKIYCPIISDNNHNNTNILSINNDIDFYNKAKDIYIKNKAWTWKIDYVPPKELKFYLSEN